jgi:hypothetical protein
MDRSTTMDELTLVARLRDDVPGIDLAGPERRLADDIAAALTAAPRRRRGSRRRVVVAGAVAAVAAVAAATTVIVVRGQPAPSAPTAVQGSTVPTGRTGPGPTAGTEAQLVAYASRAAAAAPAFDPKPSDWVYTKALAATSSAGEGGMLFGPPDGKAVQQSWARVDGRQQAYLDHGKLVISSLLPAGATGPTPGGWPNVSYPYLDSLPSDPVKLKAVIEANLKAQNYVVGSGDIGVFNAIQAVMENVVLPARLRASLYAVLARDPAVRFDRRVTDFAGQTGVAFYTLQEGYLQVEIVINPRTYAYMGDRYVAYRAHDLPAAVNNGVASGPYTHLKAGQITGESAVLESGIVTRAGQLP